MTNLPPFSYSPIGDDTGKSPKNTPVWAPFYGASIGVAFVRFWRKYADFSGRASRSEFWWWVLILQVASIAANIAGLPFHSWLASLQACFSAPQCMPDTASVDMFSGPVVTSNIIGLILFLPSLTLTVRRLHDTDRSALHLWWAVIPLIGAIILVVFSIQGARPAGERFDNPGKYLRASSLR